MKFIKTPVKGMCDMLPADMRMREQCNQRFFDGRIFGIGKRKYGTGVG